MYKLSKDNNDTTSNDLGAVVLEKDPEVKDNLKDYFDRLGKPERITLSEFLAGLTDVIVKGVPAEDAETPDEEVSITEPKKNQEKEADSEEEPSKEKPVEDTTPPIQVRR